MSTMVYLKNLFTDNQIASITPTSSYGVKKICNKIDFSQKNVIIEFGPGTGVFTKFLLKNLNINSKLILIERNINFVSILKESIKDSRVAIYHDSAENISKIVNDCSANYIISGIPFSFMSQKLRNEIIRNSYNALKKGGKFLAYQTFFQKDNHLKVHLNQYFLYVKDEYEILNVPPLKIYETIK